MIREELVQFIARVSAHTEPIGGNPHQLALQAQSFEEHAQLEAEVHHRVDPRHANLRVAITDEVAHERKVECLVLGRYPGVAP